MEHARPCRTTWSRATAPGRSAAVPRRLPRYAELAGKGQNPEGDDHHLLRQPGADLRDLRQRARRLLHPPQHRQPRAAARARTAASHGTSAAIEYAVIALGIEHLVVMGHQAAAASAAATTCWRASRPELDTPTSYVGTWLELLKPGYEALVGPRPRLRGAHRRARAGGGAGQPRKPDDLPFRGRGGRSRDGCSCTASGRTSATAASSSTTPRRRLRPALRSATKPPNLVPWPAEFARDPRGSFWSKASSFPFTRPSM